MNYWRGDQGHSESIKFEPTLDLKVSTRFTTSISGSYEHNRNDTQYFDTFTDSVGAQHYTFAHLLQQTVSLTWRLGYTFTPNTSLQIYASPFVSKGTYSNVREIGQPRADAYEARYQPYADPVVAGDPTGFNVQQFRSNVVFRWEYRPGVDPVPGLESGTGELRRSRGSQEFPWRSRRPLPPAGERYVPGESLVLVGEIDPSPLAVIGRRLSFRMASIMAPLD